jgi:hypothetical protein
MRSAIDGAAYWCALAPTMTAQPFTAASMVSNWFVLKVGHRFAQPAQRFGRERQRCPGLLRRQAHLDAHR